MDSIVADPGAYTREELAALHSQIVSNLERAWKITGRSEDELTGIMLQFRRWGATNDGEEMTVWLTPLFRDEETP